MQRLISPTLRSGDIELVPMETEHAVGLAAAAAGGRASFGLTRVPDGLDEAQRYVEDALAQVASTERMPFTVLAGGAVVGSTSYWDLQPWAWPEGSEHQRRNRPDAVEIGSTWLSESVQGTQCNKRCKLLLLEHAFEEWEVHRVSLRTDERNTASRRAIESLGAVFEGVRRAERPGQDGAIRSSAWFSIVGSEWPEVQAHLVTKLGGPSPKFNKE